MEETQARERLDLLVAEQAQSHPVTSTFQEVKIYSDHVVLKDFLGVEKAIGLTDFLKAFSEQIDNEGTTAPFFLPENCVSFSKSGSALELNLYFPEGRKTITHHKTKMDVMFPNLLMYFKLTPVNGDQWRVIDAFYFCTNRTVGELQSSIIKTPSASNQVWVMPMPNMYENGRMCYGQNVMPGTFSNNLRGLAWYYQVIFESAFNDDLGIRALNRSREPRAWLEYLENKELTSFPYSELIR